MFLVNSALRLASFAASPFSVLFHRREILEEQRKKEGRDKEKGEPALLSRVIPHLHRQTLGVGESTPQ